MRCNVPRVVPMRPLFPFVCLFSSVFDITCLLLLCNCVKTEKMESKAPPGPFWNSWKVHCMVLMYCDKKKVIHKLLLTIQALAQGLAFGKYFEKLSFYIWAPMAMGPWFFTPYTSLSPAPGKITTIFWMVFQNVSILVTWYYLFLSD